MWEFDLDISWQAVWAFHLYTGSRVNSFDCSTEKRAAEVYGKVQKVVGGCVLLLCMKAGCGTDIIGKYFAKYWGLH